MRTRQSKIRLLGMIEFPNTPAIRRVAVDALFAEAAFVYVVAFVAAVTVFSDTFVSAAGVALRARDSDMQTDQRKAT